jgi:GNAT superfamily N-acetyltransferase
LTPFGAEAAVAHIERLADHHRTGAFSCGITPLDNFLRNEAYLEDEYYGITWIVVPERGSSEVMAFYTLVYPYELDEEEDEALVVPAIELRCLAVDTRYQGTGIGTRILRGIADRILDSLDDYPIELLLLVAISRQVRAWYLSRSLGFRSTDIPENRMTLYATINDLRRLRDADPHWGQKRYTLPPFFWYIEVSGSAEEAESE